MSEINGEGYGSSHNWKRGKTSPEKFTEWNCVDCCAFFRHFYDREPNIFNAIKSHEIPDKCTLER